VAEQGGTQVQLKSSNTGPGATAQLMLMHKLMLAHHQSSAILQHKGLVHHHLEVLKVSSLQSIDQSITQAIQETLLFLLISVDFMRGVVRQLSELGDNTRS
jgi:methylmalonyl-CoA mutase cobalamin-binding subunit